MRANILIRLKKGVFDPQGAATLDALKTDGFDGVSDIRIGKLIDVTLTAPSIEAARENLKQMCEKLLANPVMENYEIELVDITEDKS